MVYYIGSFRKTRFNRNILYCKLSPAGKEKVKSPHLIETFCIVNIEIEVVANNKNSI